MRIDPAAVAGAYLEHLTPTDRGRLSEPDVHDAVFGAAGPREPLLAASPFLTDRFSSSSGTSGWARPGRDPEVPVVGLTR